MLVTVGGQPTEYGQALESQAQAAAPPDSVSPEKRLRCGGCRIACQSVEKENSMKPSTNDQIKGTIHEVKGALKEKAGQVANNPDLTAEGQGEKVAGKIQKKVGQIEKVLEK